MGYLNPTAGAAREEGVSTSAIDAGALSADAAGRAIMADDYFTAAAVLAKFADDSMTNANLLALVQDGAFVADAATRALFADRFLPWAKHALRDVEAHTAGDTLTAAESGSVHTSVGASGTITLILPVAAVGLEFFFRVGAAQELRIDPNGTDTIALPSTGVQGAAGKYLVADADGETVHLVCDKALQWSVYGFTGTWAAEG